MRGGEGVAGSQPNEYSCEHGAQINFGELLTSYLTYIGQIDINLRFCLTTKNASTGSEFLLWRLMEAGERLSEGFLSLVRSACEPPADLPLSASEFFRTVGCQKYSIHLNKLVQVTYGCSKQRLNMGFLWPLSCPRVYRFVGPLSNSTPC
jgi:hypothetical protein